MVSNTAQQPASSILHCWQPLQVATFHAPLRGGPGGGGMLCCMPTISNPVAESGWTRRLSLTGERLSWQCQIAAHTMINNTPRHMQQCKSY